MSKRRSKSKTRVVAGNKVKVIEGELFKFEKGKRYLVFIKSGSIDRDRLKMISARLQKEFGDVFTLALPPDTEMRVIETDAPENPLTPPPGMEKGVS